MNNNNSNENNEQSIPISVVIENTKNQILEVINNNGIHISVMKLILENICSHLTDLSTQVYQKEKIEYEQSMKKLTS